MDSENKNGGEGTPPDNQFNPTVSDNIISQVLRKVNGVKEQLPYVSTVNGASLLLNQTNSIVKATQSYMKAAIKAKDETLNSNSTLEKEHEALAVEVKSLKSEAKKLNVLGEKNVETTKARLDDLTKGIKHTYDELCEFKDKQHSVNERLDKKFIDQQELLDNVKGQLTKVLEVLEAVEKQAEAYEEANTEHVKAVNGLRNKVNWYSVAIMFVLALLSIFTCFASLHIVGTTSKTLSILEEAIK